VHALVSLTLTVLIMLLAVISTSMVFVAAALATIYVYVSTHSLEASLAAGLIAGIAGWMGLSLVPDLFAGLQERPSPNRG
jgi:hypothetical protein